VLGWWLKSRHQTPQTTVKTIKNATESLENASRNLEKLLGKSLKNARRDLEKSLEKNGANGPHNSFNET